MKFTFALSPNAPKRRGTTIAAAALSVAMVAPIIQPIVAPNFAATAAAQTSPEQAAATPDIANAVAAIGTTVRNWKQVRGQVYVDRVPAMYELQASSGDEPVPGAVVYLQYMNGAGQVSPVFYTVSQDDGSYYFNLDDALVASVGAPKFQLAGDSNFQIRTWM